jgi:hypothetical protein
MTRAKDKVILDIYELFQNPPRSLVCISSEYKVAGAVDQNENTHKIIFSLLNSINDRWLQRIWISSWIFGCGSDQSNVWNTGCDANAGCESDSESDGYTNSNSNSYSNSYSYSYSDGYATCDCYTYANTNTDTEPNSNSGNWPNSTVTGEGRWIFSAGL